MATFQAHLREVVDLLSRSLCSAPRANLREPLHNAFEAVAARLAPGATSAFPGSSVPRLALSRDPLVLRLVAAGAARGTGAAGAARGDGDDVVALPALRGPGIHRLLLGGDVLGPRERPWAEEPPGSLLDFALPGPVP